MTLCEGTRARQLGPSIDHVDVMGFHYLLPHDQQMTVQRRAMVNSDSSFLAFQLGHVKLRCVPYTNRMPTVSASPRTREMPPSDRDITPLAGCRQKSNAIMHQVSPRRSISKTSPLPTYLNDIRATSLLSRDEETALAARVALGDADARERMVTANLRQVVVIAGRHLGRGVDLEDLNEEGNLGLIRAVETFDGRMQTRFSTYAGYWITDSIRRACMNTAKPIRLPIYIEKLLVKWKRAVTRLGNKLGRIPTEEEVGEALCLSKKSIGIVSTAMRTKNLIAAAKSLNGDTSGLRHVLADDGGTCRASRITDADDLAQIFRQLNALNVLEAAVLRMRFGLGSDRPKTLREIGVELGLSATRVSKLENKAIRKLIEAFSDTCERPCESRTTGA